MSNIIKKITIIDENGTAQKRIGALGSDVSYNNSSSGLTTSDMQAVVDELVGGSSYAVCSTEGATAAKTVSITNFALRTGVKAVIKFTYDNTAVNPTLNISNTGAKLLIANGVSAQDVIKENSVFLVTYNGINYELVGGVGGGGHIIVDENGTEYFHRPKLKFINATITDDSINNTTVVEVGESGTTIVQKPTVTVGSYIYNGTAQGPTITWAAGMADNCIVTNATKTDAGTYVLTIALKNTSRMVWNDMTTTNLTYEYTIARATSAITLSTSSVTLDPDHLTRSVTVSNVKGRTLSASSSNTSVATVSISGSTVTINNVNQTNGSATIIISAAQSTNYNASSKTVSVSAEFSTWLDDWLMAGGLTPSSYANLDAVLADEEAIRRLFTIHASVDHLVTYKSQIGTTNLTTILNDNYVAKWINLRDYALDTLYADSTIAGYMDTADKYFYGEWVITDSTTTPATWGAKGNVPVMTSNTAPYGEAFASSVYSSSTYSSAAYYTFDRDTSSMWIPANQGYDDLYVGYKFINPVKVKQVYFYEKQDTPRLTTYKIQASNDGSNWIDITSVFTRQSSSDYEYINIPKENQDYYIYYRFKMLSGIYSRTDNMGLNELQFYGRELKMSVPTMTSDTAPYGEASASSLYGTNYAAWHAFAGGNWNGANNTSTGWIQYKFINPMIIKYWTWTITSGTSDATRAPKTYDLQGSNDGVDWEIIETYTNTITTPGKKITYNDVNNDKPYKYYRVNIRDLNGDKRYCIMRSLQFYGLDYSEYDWDTDNPRKYIYDHGVEPSGNISGGTKGEHALTLLAVGTATLTTDTTSYTAMGGKAGMRASGTNALKCGSATSNFTATNMPYGNGIDITSVNGSNAVGIAQTSTGTFDVEEVWIA